MKIPRDLSQPLASGPDPIVALVCGLDDRRLQRSVRENVVAEHRSLSKAARQAQRLAGEEGRGVFSVEVEGGSRPGMSDATFIPQADYLRGDEEADEPARRHGDAVRAALEAYDPTGEFVLQLILGGIPWVYRVRHHRAAAEDLPSRPATLLPRPKDRHAELVRSLSPKIEERIAQGAGRGLVVVQLIEGGGYRLGFTPSRGVDVPHVMALGLPEEAAIEVVEAVRSYDDLQSAAVLVAEADGSKTPYSFVRLDVRPLPKAGGAETRH